MVALLPPERATDKMSNECSKCGALVYVADGMEFNDLDCCWECLDKMVADLQSDALKTASILKALSAEIIEKVGRDVGNDTWSPDAHIELTLTAAECRKILEVTGNYVNRVKL